MEIVLDLAGRIGAALPATPEPTIWRSRVAPASLARVAKKAGGSAFQGVVKLAAVALFCGLHAPVAAAEDALMKMNQALQICEHRVADNKADGLKCYMRLTHGKYPWEPQDAPPPLQPRTAEPARNAREKDEIRVKNDKYANLEGWTRQNVRSVMESNMDLNYVTGGSGLKFGGDQTPNNMLYEGQLFENFSLLRASSTAKGNIFNTDFWLDAPVRIQLRQLTSVWKPVYTPSYNPGLRLMAAPTADFQPNNMLAYYSLGVFHYSNGQGPPPGGPDPGPLDTTTQKFNTNYVEAAAHLVKGGKSVDNDVNDFPWARLAVRQQFYGTWVPQMAGQYPRRSVSLELRTPEMAFGCGALSPASSSGQAAEQGHCLTQFRLAATYNSGYNDLVIYGGSQSAKTIPAHFSDRLNTTAELLLRPPSFKQQPLWFYIRYDHGYDYYNIDFQHGINRLQFGLAAKPF